MKASLFIGRFQPFHLGHLDAIQQSLKQTDLLFIGIGSTAENFQHENPFTVGERIQMVKAALDEAKIQPSKYLIVPIPDINNFALWPAHVEQYLPPFETVFICSSPVVEMLFENANKKRENPYEIIRIQRNFKVCATDIRKAMLMNREWQQFVPESTWELLKSWKATERIQSIQEREK